MIICDRCNQDLAPLKTVDYVSDDLHFAKCVFGTFKRVDIVDALMAKYAEDREFVELYCEMNIEESQLLKQEGKQPEDFAFCECRRGHIIGIIKEQKYYLTDISQVYLMFPNGVKEQWDSRLWQPKYKKAFELQDKLNYQRS